MTSILSVPLSDGDISRSFFRLTGKLSFFPSDIIGGSNKKLSAPKKALIRTPFEPPFETDIDGKKKFFRSDRGVYRRLFAYWGVEVGDFIEVIENKKYDYTLSLVKGRGGYSSLAYNATDVIAWLNKYSLFRLTSRDATGKLEVYVNDTGKELALDPKNMNKATIYLCERPPISLGLTAPKEYDYHHHHTTAIFRTSPALSLADYIYKQEVMNDDELKRLLAWYLTC